MPYNYILGEISERTERKLFHLGIFAILFVIGVVFGATYYFAIALPNSENTSSDSSPPSDVVNSDSVLNDKGPLQYLIWFLIIVGGLLFLGLLVTLATRATDYIGLTDSRTWNLEGVARAKVLGSDTFGDKEGVEDATMVPVEEGQYAEPTYGDAVAVAVPNPLSGVRWRNATYGQY
nr:hypothetical protein [Sicyoidochytrium minutum DNA virus]